MKMSKVCYILVGPSGSGKDTATNIMIESLNIPAYVHSLDSIRMKLCPPNYGYTEAFEYANAHKDIFNSAIASDLHSAFASGLTVFINNINTTPRARRKYIDMARIHNMKSYAIVLNTPLDVCISRRSRGLDSYSNKFISDSIVTSQYNSVILPNLTLSGSALYKT